MKSLSKRVLPDVQLSPRTYRLGIPGGGNPEDQTDPEVRLRNLEQSYQAKIAALDQSIRVEKQRAYDEGFQHGRAEAEQQAQTNLAEERQRWAGLMQQLGNAREEAYRISEVQLVDLVCCAVEKIIAARPESPEKIADILREAFSLLIEKDQLCIVCAPSDAAFIRELLTEHRDEFEDLAKFTLREDPAIGSGGCLVETEWGAIDARVEKQVAVIKQLWREAAKTPAPDESGAVS